MSEDTQKKRGRGRPPKCKTCARIVEGVDGNPYCPAINARVDPDGSQACDGRCYVKSGNRVMVRHRTSDEISRINSANARKVRNHKGGRPKLAPEMKAERTVLLRVRENDASVVRQWANENSEPIVEFFHMLVEHGRSEFDY